MTLQERFDDLPKFSVIINSNIIRQFMSQLLDSREEDILRIDKNVLHGKMTVLVLSKLASLSFSNKLYVYESDFEYIVFKFDSQKYLDEKGLI